MIGWHTCSSNYVSQFTPSHAVIQEPQLWLLGDLLRRILWKWLNFLMLLWSWPLRSRLRPKVWWFSSYEFLNTSVPLIIYYILKISQCYLRALVSNKHRNKVEGLCGNFEFRLQNSIWDCQAKAGRWGLCKTISYYWFRERNNEIQGLSWDLVLRYFCCPTLLPKTGVSVVYFCFIPQCKITYSKHWVDLLIQKNVRVPFSHILEFCFHWLLSNCLYAAWFSRRIYHVLDDCLFSSNFLLFLVPLVVLFCYQDRVGRHFSPMKLELCL